MTKYSLNNIAYVSLKKCDSVFLKVPSSKNTSVNIDTISNIDCLNVKMKFRTFSHFEGSKIDVINVKCVIPMQEANKN